MNTAEEVAAAITQLSPDDQARFRAWFEEFNRTRLSQTADPTKEASKEPRTK
jgi:hypothetical protein